MANDEQIKRKILVVDDDEAFRTALKDFLESRHFEVFQAGNGKVALDFLAQHKIDVVVSDIRMPHVTGTDLLQQIRRTSQVPFILMTGFSDILEVTQAHKLGASNFLTKPFKPQEMITMIDACVPVTGAAPVDKIHDYCPVSLEDFLGSPNLKMDIYVRLTDEKHVKIAHKGNAVSAEHIKIYKSKGITVLYIRADEFQEYVNFNSDISLRMTQKNDVPRATKVKVLKHAQEVLVKNVFLEGLDKEKIENSMAIVKSTLTVVGQDAPVFNLVNNLADLNNVEDHLYAHCLGVSAFSVMIARAMGWYSAPVLFKLSLGGMLHEIGTKEIDRAIIDKPRHELTASEAAQMDTHTFRGKEILANIPAVPGDVVQIVLQHHENGYGKGPLHLKPSAIHPLAKVVSLADRFAELVIRNPSHPLLTPTQAIEKILSDGPTEFDPACLAALSKIFNYGADKKKTA